MSTTEDPQDVGHEKTHSAALADAQDALSDCLRGADVRTPEYHRLKEAYDAVTWQRRARSERFPGLAFTPHQFTTNHEYAADLNSVSVFDSRNPHMTTTVTIDHVIEPNGQIWTRINGVHLDDVTEDPGSYIP